MLTDKKQNINNSELLKNNADEILKIRSKIKREKEESLDGRVIEAVIDEETKKSVNVKITKPKTRVKENWMSVWLEGMKAIACLHLCGTVVNTWLGLLSHIEQGGLIRISTSKLGDEIGYHKEVVRTAIETLVAKNILIVVSKERGTTPTYKLNPSIGGRADIITMDKELENFIESRGRWKEEQKARKATKEILEYDF